MRNSEQGDYANGSFSMAGSSVRTTSGRSGEKHVWKYQEDRVTTAHDWECYKNKDVYDDGTMTYFWRAHTLTVLFVLVCGLVYVAIFEPVRSDDTSYNAKRGIAYCVLVFILLGVTQISDGPFRRPHPALWRFVFCFTIVYELVLIFILFQTLEDARQLLKLLDGGLGEALDERDYGGNCYIYDSERPDDPWHNVWDKFDAFVPTHFIGWFLKTLMLRDYWLCLVQSIMFEVLEYTLEHQLPNFSECWWDHWILDAAICNGLGIYLGMKALQYLSMKPYHWRGLWSIPTYRGKLKRIIAQFGPHSWMDYDWKPSSSLTRWCSMILVIIVFLMAELNTFYLKFILWVPPAHYLNLVRLFMFILAGAVAMRETFQYFDDPKCRTFGRQSWMVLAIIITEFLVIAKFGWNVITKPLPRHVAIFWLIGILGIVLWTVWNFFINTPRQTIEKHNHITKRASRGHDSQSHNSVSKGVRNQIKKKN